MKKRIIVVLALAVVAAAFLLTGPQSVMARIAPPSKPTNPAAGSWSWDDADVTGTTVPQYQLAPTNGDDYALLQSAGLYVSGGTQLCHPYPGGQHGWNAEIRVLTNSGWQSVHTVNQWVPDVEGKFMTCATVWYSGTYAVFGYWVKPEGWGEVVSNACDALPKLKGDDEWKYVSSAATFDWAQADLHFAGTTGDRCSSSFSGAIEADNVIESGVPKGKQSWRLPGYECACDSMYKFVSSFPQPGPKPD